MTITVSQRTSIMILWGKVCKDRGWKSSDKTFRLAKFSEIIGRPIASADEIERIDECTKLMKELQAMLGVSVQAAQEADNLYINRARVLRNKILTELVPCLEIYVADVNAYMTEIMEDKNRWWKIDRPARGMTLMDLTAEPSRKFDFKTRTMKEFPSQLDQMVYTLSSCLNGSGKVRAGKKSRLGFRVAAGQTLHEMKTKAGVPCDCADCARGSVIITAPAPLAELADTMQAKEEQEHEEQPF
jgi:bacterioferritin-associated ferredoxin